MTIRKRLNRVLRDIDIVLEVIDARVPEESRLRAIENMAKANDKGLLIIVNKTDLVSPRQAEKIQRELKKEGIDSVLLSTKNRWGKVKLIKKLLSMKKQKPVKAMIIGFPNVGKSSILNYLKGQKSAYTSPRPNFTKAEQLLKIVDKKLYIYDMPGIIVPSSFKRKVLCSSIPLEKIQDKEGASKIILERLTDASFKDFYGLTKEEFFKKYGDKAYEKILKDWYRGKLGLSKQERPMINRFRTLNHPFGQRIKELLSEYKGPMTPREIAYYLYDKIPENVRNIVSVYDFDDYRLLILCRPRSELQLENMAKDLVQGYVKVDEFKLGKRLKVILYKRHRL